MVYVDVVESTFRFLALSTPMSTLIPKLGVEWGRWAQFDIGIPAKWG